MASGRICEFPVIHCTQNLSERMQLFVFFSVYCRMSVIAECISAEALNEGSILMMCIYTYVSVTLAVSASLSPTCIRARA